MVAFVLGTYTLPHLVTVPVHTWKHTHTHRTFEGWTWDEDMDLSLCVPAVRLKDLPTTIANDNQRIAS